MAGKVISRFQSGSGIHLISSTFYGTCDTDADVEIKRVKINDGHVTELKLIPGMLLSVKFTNGNTATNPQLKILDSNNNVLKDAILIAPDTLIWGAGNVLLFVYDNNNNNERWISNYLSLSGGTLTGKLDIQDSDIDIAITPSSNQYDRVFEVHDSNDKEIMNITAVHSTNNYHGFSIGVYDPDTGQQNTIQLTQNNNNGYAVWISQPSNWRSALGIGTIGTKNTLTASDIPDIPALKITSGTLPIEYGGTGATTVSGARVALNVVGASDQSRQNARFITYAGADQIYGLYATCINANNTAFNGKEVGVIFENDGIALYNGTDNTFPWKAKFKNESTSTIASVITVNSTNATIVEAQRVIAGKVCQLNIFWKNQAAISVPANGNITNVTIGTLPANFRPAIFSGAWSHGDNGGAAWYNITTGGTVSLGAVESTGSARTIAAGTEFRLLTTFILP